MSDENNSEKNPFEGLIASENSIANKNLNEKNVNAYDQIINTLIENVFLITVRRTNIPKGKQLIYMEEIAQNSSQSHLTLDYLDHALFERILLQTPQDFLIPNQMNSETNPDVAETKIFNYLYKSFVRNEICFNENSSVLKDACNRINDLIFRNITTALKQPELFDGQNLSEQWLGIYQYYDDDFDIKMKFFKLSAKAIHEDEDELNALPAMKQIFYPMLIEIYKKIKDSSLTGLDKWIIPFLRCFAQDKTNLKLAEVLLDFVTPHSDSEGIKYAETIFGQLLSISILPKTHNGPYEYYDNPNETVTSNAMTSSLWNYLKLHLDDIHLLFKDFLILGGDAREKLLNWFGNCLNANTARGQIWNQHSMQVLGNTKTASDSFMIGLASVLLRLCKPLLKPQLKVMIVDPSYCAVIETDRIKKGVHMKGMDKETSLVPIEENEVRLVAEKYNFVTECFFMTHKAIDLGFRVCIEKLIRMNREIVRLQGAYQDTVQQNGVDLASNLFQMLKTQIQQFFSLRNTIVEPTTDGLILQFYEASSIWLNNVTANLDRVECNTLDKGFAPQKNHTISLPLVQHHVSPFLKSIPEFIIENIINYLTFSRHFETSSLESDIVAQTEILTMILVFMGSSENARNPHLRAKLAEALESLLPKEYSNSFRTNFSSIIFKTHPHMLEITPSLLQVFVEIEMTGQSVQFEQKFNYRRPMYAIMEYLWEIEEHRNCFKKLAIEAEKNIEEVNPPIFLRFINLLINDAIFLLDESLSNLQQIRTLQDAQARGEWENLSANEQQQNRANLQHLGMMAKFDNILGRDTIKILKLITEQIKGIFCHASMVDRVAAMLNYFLLHLVGPKMGNLNVKDKKEFEFNPGHTVKEICQIYINLKESEAFCLTVSQDGRSYSPQLFDYAEQVLVRIGGGYLIAGLNELAIKVKRLDQQQKEDQEALVDPPDDFLDPIMSALMIDPVTLPSSHVTVDRSTIARHLLSDQSDPFNRSPLTMDQIIPNIELKTKIEEWIAQRREKYSKNKEIQPQ